MYLYIGVDVSRHWLGGISERCLRTYAKADMFKSVIIQFFRNIECRIKRQKQFPNKYKKNILGLMANFSVRALFLVNLK